MRRHNLIAFLQATSVLVSAAFVSGCVSFGANLDAKDLTSKPATIRGIGKFDDRDGQARMLVVHGMGGDRCPGYSVSNYRFDDSKKETPGMLSRMSEKMEVCLLADPRDHEKKHCDEGNVVTYPTLKLTKFDYAKAVDGQDCDGVSVMRVYELYYTGAGEKAEQRIIDYNKATLGSSVVVNRIIKQDLMVSGFGDAVKYLGEWGDTIRGAVRETLCQMATEALTRPANYDVNCLSTVATAAFIESEVYILSHSLGSNILLDTLDEILANRTKADLEATLIEQLVGNVRNAYLMANQDALLGMVSVTPGDAQSINNTLTGLVTYLSDEAQVVAFSGRNDALSYALATDACPAKDTQCVNAALNIARWGIPFFFANPVKAHTGYVDDKTVIDCVASGCE